MTLGSAAKLHDKMRSIRTMEEANEVTAVRLSEKRRFAKVGDCFACRRTLACSSGGD
jgi:hypothetical protein